MRVIIEIGYLGITELGSVIIIDLVEYIIYQGVKLVGNRED